MKSEKEKIISLLKRTFDKGAWHGPTVKEVLASVDSRTSSSRLHDTHSIIELVAHMTTWRVYVTSKLRGNDDFQVSDEVNFPKVTDWAKALDELYRSQENLLAAIEAFPEDRLSQLVQGVTDKYTYYTLIHGIIHHDLYHTGQIRLIAKATVKQTL